MSELSIIKLDEFNLPEESKKGILSGFSKFIDDASNWEIKAKALIITSVDQKEEIKEARIARLALKNIRVDADKTKKRLKEDSLNYGKAVQSAYNLIESIVKPIESHLKEQERFVEIQEAKRIADIASIREIEIQSFRKFVPYGINFGTMPDEDFAKLLNGAKLKFQKKIEDDEKAEADRIKKEHEEKERQEAILLENERLKAENKARQEKEESERKEREVAQKIADEKAAAEKAESERIAKAEKDKSDAIIAEQKRIADEAKAELKKQQDAEFARQEAEKAKAEQLEKEKAESERKAKSAPDKEKLLLFANTISMVEFPDLSTPDAKQISDNVKKLLGKVHSYIIEQSKSL